MSVLVDSSVWISYFRGAEEADDLDPLIEENLVCVNELILAELIPSLHVRRQRKLIRLLREVERHPLRIDWDGVIRVQITCLRNGVNGVGISDLIIAQHAIRHGLDLYAYDKHFTLMAEHMPLSLY